jgi:hypothetical protein
LVRSEGDTIIERRVDVMKSVKGRLHVTRRWFVAIRSEEGMGSDKIGASRVGEPADATDQALISLLTTLKRRRVIVLS